MAKFLTGTDRGTGGLRVDEAAGGLITTADALLGSITTNTADGTNGTHAGITKGGTGWATSGSGIDAVFTVIVSSNVVTSITATTAGSDFAIGDTITFSTTSAIGGSTAVVFTLQGGDTDIDDVYGVNHISVSEATLTDNGGGHVTITTGGGGGGVTMTNGASNRVTTATSATNIDGESNLTFDGGTLAITGDLTTTTSVAATTTVTAGTTVSATTTVTGGTGLIATTGGVTSTSGDIIANVGAITAVAGVVTGGIGVVATTGDITASLGSISAGGTVTGTTGVTASTGNIIATTGAIIANSMISNAGLTLNTGEEQVGDGGDIDPVSNSFFFLDGPTAALQAATAGGQVIHIFAVDTTVIDCSLAPIGQGAKETITLTVDVDNEASVSLYSSGIAGDAWFVVGGTSVIVS